MREPSWKRTLRERCKTLKDLSPTASEIQGYARILIDSGRAHGIVKTGSKGCFSPKLHEPRKPPSPLTRRVPTHIDLGSQGTHLCLDVKDASDFIWYINKKREVLHAYIRAEGWT